MLSSQRPSLKLLVLGTPKSGKSSLVLRFCDDRFPQSYLPSSGIDISHRFYFLDNHLYDLSIWSVSQEEDSLLGWCFKAVKGVIMVYNITERKTIQELMELETWKEYVQGDKGIVRYLVGTHLDQERKREVGKEEAQQVAFKYGFKHIEVSSRFGTNVQELFRGLIKQIVNLMNLVHSDNQPIKLRVRIPGPVHKSCC